MTPEEAPTYRLEVRVSERSAEVALVAQGRGPTAWADEVWSHRFTSVDAAGRIIGPLIKLRKEWRRWGRMARLLGPDFLDGVMDGELLRADSTGLARLRIDRHFSLDASYPRPRAMAIRMKLLATTDASCISAYHEGRSFMELTLPSPIQAHRVWDWLRWQTDRYRSMFEFREREGASVLVVLIVAEVLRAERQALLTCGPRDLERPLRHWRPPGHAEAMDVDDERSDEAFG